MTGKISRLTKEDFDYIISVLDQWWGGPAGRRTDPMFFYEFGRDALVFKKDGKVVGFLLGIVMTGSAETSYIHLVGIHPDHRRRGIGKVLYEHFMDRCRSAEMKQIKAISSTGDEKAVNFHKAMGFTAKNIEHYAGPNRPRTVFLKKF